MTAVPYAVLPWAVLHIFERARSLATTGLYEELHEVAAAEGTTLEVVLSRDRRAPTVRGRRAVVLRLLEHGYKPPRIGDLLGRDPTTVRDLARRALS
jgi:hypothetical protein